MGQNSNIRILIYIFLVAIVVLFEEPRVSELLKTVFAEDDFRPFFSYAIPILFIAGLVLSGKKWIRIVLNLSFFALLFLSYGNTIRTSYSQLVTSKDIKIKSLEESKIEKSKFLLTDPELRTCYSPRKNSENYENEYNYYRYCLSENEKVKESYSEKKALIQSEYDSIVKQILQLKSTPIDLSLPITQGLTGFILSVILGTVGSIFAGKLTREMEVSRIISLEEKIAIMIAQGYSPKEISQKLKISKSTVYRKYELMRSKKHFPKGGKIWENVRKSGNLVGKQWETEIPDEILVGGQS